MTRIQQQRFDSAVDALMSVQGMERTAAEAVVRARFAARKHKSQIATSARRARHDAYMSLGMVRVRGALGGVYYE